MFWRRLVKLLLSGLVPLVSVLVYFQLECVREKEESLRSKLSPHYRPDQTDCTAELPFLNHTVHRTELSMGKRRERRFLMSTCCPGPEYFLAQSLPCFVTKLITLVSSYLG